MMRKSGPLKHPASRNVVSYVLRRWQPLLTGLQTCWRSFQNSRHSHGLMLFRPAQPSNFSDTPDVKHRKTHYDSYFCLVLHQH